MTANLLKLEDLRGMNSPEAIANVFKRLGYNKVSCPIEISDLDVSARNAEAVYDAHLIADQSNGELQVLLFKLQESEWETPSTASTRMKVIATQVGKRDTEFLLLATKDYNQLMLVNPRKTVDDKQNVKVNIRKLLIDRTNPTNYDRERLESLAVNGKSPKELYKTHCEEFDVEKLTKSFYKGYKELFERVQAAVKQYNPDPYFDDADRLHQFSQRLLGRIMFLYFLQKKEFLAGDRRFLTTQYKIVHREENEFDYYQTVLEPLFFDTLNKQRPNFDSQWGKIPYLNGGLFDRDYGPEIRDTAGRETPEAITLPNSLFNPGNTESILFYFNSYNFTVAENVIGDEDIAVDPEMLGKVFENMLAAEERGKSGTFYTPRGIVQFMCSEVLARYLADETGMELDKVQELMNYDPDVTPEKIKELISPQQAKALKKAIEEIKVLDPAVGSGAFPLGMMQLLLSVRQAVARREGMTVQRGSLTISQWKREIIANNLYGVDIKPEAIEIAKLRMWLSLVVDIPRIEDVEPLPNLDYKLMCGDSLISTIHGEQLIPDPNKDKLQLEINVTPIQKAIQPLLELQHKYFGAQSEERHELRKQILEAEANVFREAVGHRRNFWLGKQTELEQKIKLMKGKVSKAQEKEQSEITAKLVELDKFAQEVEKGDRALNFFQYHLHFRDVFAEKGGFDCVIGNPPYVRQEQIKDIKPALKKEYDCYTGVADLYVYFYEQGIRLLKSKGYLSYISSNKYFRAGYGEKLRKYLGENETIEVLIDFGDTHVFEAIAYPSIILVSKFKTENNYARILNWEKDKSVDEFVSVYKKNSLLIFQKELTSNGWRLESPSILRLLDRLKNAGISLEKYVNGKFYRGIITGFNEAFIVGKETRDELISKHQSSAEILKPFLRGRDVKRWYVDYQDLYIIFTRRGIDITKYPAILEYLSQYQKQLTPGGVGGRKQSTCKWYEIQDPIAYWQEFETSKIIYPNICKRNEFTLDKSGYYTNQKAFIIPCKNMFLLAVLNSSAIMFLFDKLLPKLEGDFYEPSSIFMKKFPIPTVLKLDRLAIEALVQKCLDAKGIGVEEWEAEIDDRVAHLYGLTADEMKIIKGE